MADRASWTTTTHDWSRDVDREHLAAVREHAAVVAPTGVQHLVLEVLAYADEEAAALGRPGRCLVTWHADGSVSVADDGRGTDTRRDDAGRIVRKPVMATQDVRFVAADPVPLPDGSRRHGMSVVAALSVWLEHTNHRAEGSWTQRYEHGVPVDELVEVPSDGRTGTTVRFRPDLDLVAVGTVDPRALGAFPHLAVTCARDERGPRPGGA